MALGEQLAALVQDVYANRLIPGLTIGLDVTLARRMGTYDPATGQTPSTPTLEVRRAIFRPFTAAEMVRGNGLLREGDVELRILAADGMSAPAADDLVTVGTMTFRIVAVTTKCLDGKPVEYVCRARK